MRLGHAGNGFQMHMSIMSPIAIFILACLYGKVAFNMGKVNPFPPWENFF